MATQNYQTTSTVSPDSFKVDIVTDLLENGLTGPSVDDQDALLCAGLLVSTKMGKILNCITLIRFELPAFSLIHMLTHTI